MGQSNPKGRNKDLNIYGTGRQKHKTFALPKKVIFRGTWGIVLAGFADLPFCIVRFDYTKCV